MPIAPPHPQCDNQICCHCCHCGTALPSVRTSGIERCGKMLSKRGWGSFPGAEVWGHFLAPLPRSAVLNAESTKCMHSGGKHFQRFIIVLWAQRPSSAPSVPYSGPYEEPHLQTSSVCDRLAPSKSAVKVGFLFLLKLFTVRDNGVIGTKFSSPGQSEWSHLCAKTVTTSWFYLKQADVQFVDKNLPEKPALGSTPPELLGLWQEAQRPSARSIIMFTSQLWNGCAMCYWNWFLHYPVAFWFLKEIKIPFFPKKGSTDLQISLPT